MGKNISGSEKWTKLIREKAGESYVVFNQGFQQPSKYNFYTRSTKGFAYNSMYYRKNQYDIWPIEDSIREKEIYYVSTFPHMNISNKIMFILFGEKTEQDSFFMENRMHYGRWIKNARLYQKVNIQPGKMSYNWRSNEITNLRITIQNPYKDTINFSNTDQQWRSFFEYAYISNGDISGIYSLGNILEQVIIPPGAARTISVNIKAPQEPGNYKLIFSLRTEPFAGTRNSRMVNINTR